VEDVGLQDWVLWNARGVYPAAALRRLPGATGLGDASGAPDRAGHQ
jgi:hypothetical protein